MEGRKKMTLEVRGKGGFEVFGVENGQLQAEGGSVEATELLISADGHTRLLLRADRVETYDVASGELRLSIPGKFTVAALSPRGTYVSTYRRNLDDEGAPNVEIWRQDAGGQPKCVGAYVQRQLVSRLWPTMRFTACERYAARVVQGELCLYDPEKAAGGNFCSSFLWKLPHSRVSEFCFAPIAPDSSHVTAVAVFAPAPAKGGSMGSVAVFDLNQLSKPAVQTSFGRGEMASFWWSPLADRLLVAVRTEVDRTGQSYYGESRLYYLSSANPAPKAMALTEGAFVDCDWHPQGVKFVVIDGVSPADTRIYDQDAKPLASLGKGQRNVCRWSPCGRFLAVAGFGNIKGPLEFWDPNHLRVIGSALFPYAAELRWAPDCECVAVGVLAPKMRVDNAVSVVDYTGATICSRPFDALYQMAWRVQPLTDFPLRKIRKPAKNPAPSAKTAASSSTSSTSAPATGVYVPPSLRNRDASLNAEPSLGPTRSAPVRLSASPSRAQKPAGLDLPPGLSLTSEPKKKNTPAAPKKAAQAQAKPSPQQKAEPAAAQDASNPQPTAPPANRLRNLVKRLKQIEDLEAKASAGAVLDADQQKKIASRQEVEKEIAELRVLVEESSN